MREIKEQNLQGKEAMYKLACSFICSRQLSVQEAVYFCLPELWLRKCCPAILFINTNLREEYSKLNFLKTVEMFLKTELSRDNKNTSIKQDFV